MNRTTVLIINFFEHNACGHLSHFPYRVIDRGQLGAEIRCEKDIVKTHDGNFFRDIDIALTQNTKRASRHFIVRTNHRGKTLAGLQQVLHPLVAAGFLEISFEHQAGIELDAEFHECAECQVPLVPALPPEEAPDPDAKLVPVFRTSEPMMLPIAP